MPVIYARQLNPLLLSGIKRMQPTKPTSTAPAKRTISGFTLVEVLIALIILSVGMLGIAGLYVHS
ncbi:protein of unknown function, partial [uncultured Woeseiaceae bacterium]